MTQTPDTVTAEPAATKTIASEIAPALARALEKKGYAALTEVQEAVLKPEAAGRDLLVSAQTGSGKTVAFGMAIAPTLLGVEEAFTRAGKPLALLVAPTRELALQVQRELVWLYADARGRITSCVGGMDARSERRALERGCHIVVGTPGRLRDHIERGALDMSTLQAVVLDEADEMLDYGFREDLEFILDTAPTERRTLLFSATVPRTIANMAKRYQNNALRISTVEERTQHRDIEYRALSVAPSDRENAIINLLRYYDADSTLVFCATREGVNRLSSRLGNRGFSAVALSGELSQNERTHALQAMRDGRARVCIATDVASRGLDLPGLELVIHADLPTNGEVLVHRSGRTGRAGQKGTCVLVVPHTRRGHANRLMRSAKVEAEWGSAPSPEDIQAKDRMRLFADPALSATYDDDALSTARELLEQHGAEQIAAAFLDRRVSELPAAEELLDAPGKPETSGKREFTRKERAPFVGGVWFRVSAGRKHRAEPRWLLPLICRLGHVTKKDVGSIKVGEKESRFEVSAAAAERFAAALDETGGREKSILITRDDAAAMPAATGDAAPAPRKKKPYKAEDQKPHSDRPKAHKSMAQKPRAEDAKDHKSDKEFPKSDRPKAPGKKKKQRWTGSEKKAAKLAKSAAAARAKKDAKAAGETPLKRSKKKTQDAD